MSGSFCIPGLGRNDDCFCRTSRVESLQGSDFRVIYADLDGDLVDLPNGPQGDYLAVGAGGTLEWVPGTSVLAHSLASTTHLGAEHTVAGLTAGMFLQAIAPNDACFRDITGDAFTWTNTHTFNLGAVIKSGQNLIFEPDCTIYRSGANLLRTDDSLYVNGQIHTGNRVGVANASPAVTLDVRSAPGAPAVAGATQTFGMFRIAANTANVQALDFGNYDAGTYGSWIQAIDRGNLAINYPLCLNPNGGRVGIGTNAPTSELHVTGLLEHADNAAALLAGLTAGAFYRTGDLLKVVH